AEFGLGGLALAVCGLLWLGRRPALAALFGLSFVAAAAFALLYRVPDPESFYLTSYYFVAAAAGFGAMALIQTATRLSLSGGGAQRTVAEALSFLPVLLPVLLFTGNLERS